VINGVNETFHLNYVFVDYGIDFYGGLVKLEEVMRSLNNTYLLGHVVFDFHTAIDVFNNISSMYLFPENGHKKIYNSRYGLSTGTAFTK